FFIFFFSSRRRHTRSKRDWSSDVCSSDLILRRLKMPVGSVFKPKDLQKDVQMIEDLYGAKGYIGERDADHVPVIAHRNANTQTRSEERRVGKECRSRKWRK